MRIRGAAGLGNLAAMTATALALVFLSGSGEPTREVGEDAVVFVQVPAGTLPSATSSESLDQPYPSGSQVCVWSAAEPEKLPSNIAEELDNDFNELWFSPISVWEILLLAEKGRVSLGPDNIKSVRDIFRTIPLKEAPLNLEVAVQSRSVNLPHQDPADRFLAATAVVYDLTLVTADSRIIDAESVAVLPAL